MSLSIHQMSFSVGNKNLLNQVSFDSNQGEFVGIVGANGAGKSTLLKSISKEYQSKGDAHWFGLSLMNMSEQNAAKIRSVLTQQTFMSIDFMVEEVVLMGRYPHFQSTPTSKDWNIVKDEMSKLGIDHLAKRNYQTLSGGEKQRVQIARAFAQLADASSPTFMLLDEPLNNLDIKYQHQCLSRTIAYTNEGNTALMVIHDINLAALYADKILLLKDGELVEYGTPDKVLSESNLSKAYDFDVRVERHPHHDCPIAYFGCPIKSNTPVESKTETLK